jgi:replicative DNA helicase
MKYDNVCSAVVQNMKKEFLPDKSFQEINRVISKHYETYKTAPSYPTLLQSFAGDYDSIELINTFQEYDGVKKVDAVLDMLESYIKSVKLQSIYTEVGKLYNQNEQEKAQDKLKEYAEWLGGFTLKSSSFINIAKTFKQRFLQNRQKEEDNKTSKLLQVTRFYIDDIDDLNDGRNLRGQLSCFMASTGVGKSHIARHIGIRAMVDDGLDVLHFQLEGSEDEVVDAYSGGLISKNSFLFEKGKISDAEMRVFEEQINSYIGSVTVRAFPRFNNNVSTIDIQNGISEFRKMTGRNPDVVIVDSMDLLTDASGRSWGADHERAKRIAVANDLKDLANDENVWLVATYQATIENREWLNDEKNVLTEYNCSEAKGLSRPLTHLITLNQSEAERNEDTMRLHIAKARFFKKGDTFKIATDYQNEIFYDHKRTMGLKISRD